MNFDFFKKGPLFILTLQSMKYKTFCYDAAVEICWAKRRCQGEYLRVILLSTRTAH